MSNVSEWDTSAGGNTDASPNGWPEAMAPSSVNDAARENMAAIARWYQDTNGTLITGGTGNAFTITSNNSHAALADQSFLVFQADRANTGAATLNVDGLGAKALEFAGSALASGDLVADSIYIAVYNSTNDAYDLIGGAVPDGSVSTAKIADEAVTNAKLAHMAQATIKGRASGAGTGDATDLTAAQVRTVINVENGATADQTASEILTALLTVDGAGSGVDADLLDGVQGANYLRSNVSDTFTGTLTVAGAITCSGDITGNTSDERLKEDWADLQDTLSRMADVQAGTYRFTRQARELNPAASDARRLGFSAQSIARHWPEAVAPAPFDIDPETGASKSGENYLTIRYEHLVPVLWQAVLDLQAKIEALKA